MKTQIKAMKIELYAFLTEPIKSYRVSQKTAPIKQTKMAKHGRLVNIPKWSNRVQKGPKWST